MNAETSAAALALPLSLVLTPAAIALLRRKNVLDLPNERSSHDRPVPRGAGIAPGVALLVALGIAPRHGTLSFALLGAAAGLGFVGLLDDLRTLSPQVRFGLQALIAAVLTGLLVSGLTGPAAWRIVFTAGVWLWILSYVNAYNFMDGINGISSAQAVVAGTAWLVLGFLHDRPLFEFAGLAVAAAAAGFLPYNFPLARAFLGDVGSYAIGAWIAVAAVAGLRAGLPFEAVFAPLGAYLADTSATLLRRAMRGEDWYRPHRDHAYQRLTKLGWSHTRATGVVAATQIVCSVLGFASLAPGLMLRVAADAAILVVLAVYVTLPRTLGYREPATRAA